MYVDRYTKGLLTVIACALCIQVMQGTIARGRADALDVLKVKICDTPFQCAALTPTIATSGPMRITGYALAVAQQP
jgi:hypothetical protein